MKKFISIVIFISILFSLSGIYAEELKTLNLTASRLRLLNTSLSYKRHVKQERDAYQNYKNAVTRAENYEDDRSVNAGRITYLVPKQMENSWLTAVENRKSLKNSLLLELRKSYLKLYDSFNNAKIKGERLKLALEEYDKNVIMYNEGMISAIDINDAEYALMSAEYEFASAQRGLENATRSFNLLIGEDIELCYDVIMSSENRKFTITRDEEFYVSNALNNRKEVKQLGRRIDLIKEEISILKRDRQYQTVVAVVRHFAGLEDNLEKTKLQLERVKNDIENEVRVLYSSVVAKDKELEVAGQSLDLKKENFRHIKAKYDAGLISGSNLKSAELDLKQAEYDYWSKLFDYNTSVLELDCKIQE